MVSQVLEKEISTPFVLSGHQVQGTSNRSVRKILWECPKNNSEEEGLSSSTHK